MPSRQERRTATRDAAKRAPSQTGAGGAGGAGGAAAAVANVNVNVNVNSVGDWTTQAADPYVLMRSEPPSYGGLARATGRRSLARDACWWLTLGLRGRIWARPVDRQRRR